MQIKSTALAAQLQKGLSPLIFIHGDEPLLIEDAHQLTVKHYQNNGYDERIVLHVEAGFDWHSLLQHLDSMSLFSNTKIIELRMPTGRPGTKGAQILADYANNPASDICLLIISQKLDASTKRTNWCKAIDSNGLIVENPKIYPNQLGAWIIARAKNYQSVLDKEATETLSYYLEGNLLSIDQVLKQLQLLSADNKVTGEDVAEIVSDSSRYNTFSLADACLLGDAKNALHILHSLIREKAEPVLINWALQKEIRLLLQLAIDKHQGKSLSESFQEMRVWQTRQAIMQKALQRLSGAKLTALHSRCQQLDQFIKGANDDYSGNSNRDKQLWHHFEKLITLFC